MSSKSDPAKSHTHRNRGNLSADDMNLWHQVRRTVEPLPGRKTDHDEWLEAIREENRIPAAQRSPVKPDSLSDSNENLQRSFPVASYSPPVSGPTASSGAIDDKTAKKLLKGRLSIEDRIDLHGMTQSQAHRLLDAFLARSHASGMRIVLVITGKGRTTGGILRQMVPQWLREPHLSTYVSAFRTAHVTHGGEGALYVRLRRQGRKR